VHRYDENGTPRGAPGHFSMGGDCETAAPGSRLVGLAVSGAGEALVVEISGGTAWLWWVNADGSAARPPLAAGDAGGPGGVFTTGLPIELRPLLDGSIVASEGGVWTRRFPLLGDHAEDAPAWLAARPRWRFRNTRGSRGYVLLPPGTVSTDCSQEIELLARSGRLCGRAVFADPGQPCDPVRNGATIDQGWDGTVVQQSPRAHCAWRFWPRLLAGD